VVGWPVGEAPGADAKPRQVPTGVTTVVDLMQRVDREEPAEKLEAVVKNDPTLAFRLMRYLNSPGFGLSVEISSFRHALMILGYARLKRWLALLVTSAIDDPDLKPLMHLAVRRGLLMEEIARPGGDDTLRNELFICGVFSTLDRMLGQPFERLLKSIPVQETVAQALVEDAGPCAPFLAIARAVEQESAYDIRESAEALMLTVGDVNRALAKSLVHAHSLAAG
jgi:EAL and modified HD-GYP domain-containing signal transduction protein